jgi:hypothetical protein
MPPPALLAPFVWLASLWALRAILRARRLRLSI